MGAIEDVQAELANQTTEVAKLTATVQTVLSTLTDLKAIVAGSGDASSKVDQIKASLVANDTAIAAAEAALSAAVAPTPAPAVVPSAPTT